MNTFQKQCIDACKRIWNERFTASDLPFSEKHGGDIGTYYTALGEVPHGKIAVVVYEDEAGVSYTDNRWSRWHKFVRLGWGLPSYMFEKPDYDSPEALGTAFVDRFSSLIERNDH